MTAGKCEPAEMQDPSIKQMAEQIANDPSFKEIAKQMQESFGAMMGGMPGMPGAPAAASEPRAAQAGTCLLSSRSFATNGDA